MAGERLVGEVLQELRDKISQPDPVLVVDPTNGKAEFMPSAPAYCCLIDEKGLFAVRQHDEQGEEGSHGNLYVAIDTPAS